MLVALTCGCSGSQPLVRSFLSSRHHPDPFSVRIYQKEEALGWANKNNLTPLASYIGSMSTYAIIVGWDSPTNIHWADINNPSPDQKMKAEAIVDKFGTS